MFSEWSGFLEQEIINRRAGVGFDHFDVLSVDVNNLRQVKPADKMQIVNKY